MSGTISRPVRRTPGFAALMLLTAAALVLSGRVAPMVGDALLLVMGLELLVWARSAREDGLLITGGVVSGVGLGVLLAAGPLLDATPAAFGAAFGLSVAGGFVLVAALSRWWLDVRHTWAWIAAAVVGTVGAGLFGDAVGVPDVMAWAVPAGLLAAGIAAAVRWTRA